MRIISIHQNKEEEGFAQKAIEAMRDNPKLYTYAEGDPSAGRLLAIRWNPFTVLVVKLDEAHEPALYPTHDFIGDDLPPLRAI